MECSPLNKSQWRVRVTAKRSIKLFYFWIISKIKKFYIWMWGIGALVNSGVREEHREPVNNTKGSTFEKRSYGARENGQAKANSSSWATQNPKTNTKNQVDSLLQLSFFYFPQRSFHLLLVTFSLSVNLFLLYQLDCLGTLSFESEFLTK